MAEKYFEWSPFSYVGDNPILRTDTDGMDWSDKKIYNDEGTLVAIERTLTFSVNNKSKNLTSSDVNSRVDAISSAIKDAYSGDYKDDDGNKVNVTVNVVVDPNETDFVLEFTDQVVDDKGNPVEVEDGNVTGKVDRIGDTKNNQVQVKVTNNEQNDEDTAVHEFGHTAGLRHENDKKNPIRKSVTEDNYMWSKQNNIRPKKINKKQRKEMNQYIEDEK